MLRGIVGGGGEKERGRWGGGKGREREEEVRREGRTVDRGAVVGEGWDGGGG